MASIYDLVKAARNYYDLLQDEQSKCVFRARVAVDIDPSMTNVVRLLRLNPTLTAQELAQIDEWKDAFRSVREKGKKLVLYGTGECGRASAQALLRDNVEFDCFCGQRGKDGFPNGLLGKDVISPDYLIEHMDDYYVAIFAVASQKEIISFLRENNFPIDHIISNLEPYNTEKQYFEFPSLYRRNTVFVDAGCFDCQDDYNFVAWCGGNFSSIFAFEPDPILYAKCQERIKNQKISNYHLIQAGVSDKTGSLTFFAKATGSSCIAYPTDGTSSENTISIRTVTIDDTIGKQEVGFIKMDIEGAEYDALQGAKETIQRDKPFLAICVYHKQGDVLAIMNYLHGIVPEYHFWLRHYGPLFYETVLYASVDTVREQDQEKVL